VNRFVTSLVALAAAFAVAGAEEPTQGAKPVGAGVPAAPVAAPPSTVDATAQQAVQSLRHLRLHPGEDSRGVEETTRGRLPAPER
jgi:hypothetical protein